MTALPAARCSTGPHRPTVGVIVLASVIQALAVASLLGALGLVFN